MEHPRQKCHDAGVAPSRTAPATSLPVATARGGIVSRPALFQRLSGAGRVVEISASAGSGKTYLLRAWIEKCGLAARVAWASVGREERDAQRFWISVGDALRRTDPGSKVVRGLTAAPELDCWAVVEQLIEDVAALPERTWLVVDDLHELSSNEAMRQLELVLMRAPPHLRFLLVTRHDLQLGLHRLRLDGELTEIRAADLRFSVAESRALLHAAGVEVPDSTLGRLVERTEGWAAGLRLATLSLVGHPDPERFVDEFSGSDRTVAEYLLTEVLDRQPDPVRRLLLRTSVLSRVNGELADLLAGTRGAEGILQDLERANAFVVSVDGRRSWFRYHQLFAELLALELRRTEPDLIPVLHAAAAGWYGQRGDPVEAIRHAQAAEDWDLAARLLSDHWFRLELNGQAAGAHQLLSAFPTGVVSADAELLALMAGDERVHGSLEEAQRYLSLALRRLASVPAERRGRFQTTLGILGLALARQRGDLPTVIEQAQQLLSPLQGTAAADPGTSGERRALALISLGTAGLWTGPDPQAERHLHQGFVLAQRIREPYLEMSALAHMAVDAFRRSSFVLCEQRTTQALELAERHGWTEEPIAALVYLSRGTPLIFQYRLVEAAPWLERAERALRAELEPATAVTLYLVRGLLEMARGRYHDALGRFHSAEQLAEGLATRHVLALRVRSLQLQTLIRMGQPERVERALAAMEQSDRDSAEIGAATATLHLAQNQPEAAMSLLAPLLACPEALTITRPWVLQLRLLEANALDALGDVDAAERSLEQALELGEPDHVRYPFVVDTAPHLLQRHSLDVTAHPALLSEVLDLVSGTTPGMAVGEPQPLRDRLTESEARVLRYLPTNLSSPEIARELYLSANTVKTHMRHLYDKLGVHSRRDAVERARTLGLLGRSSRITPTG